MVEVRKITVGETYDIRLKILRINSPLPYKFQGDFDGDAFHFGTFEKQTITGYCKLCEIHSPFI